MIKHVFVVFSIFLVLALSVVPVFASEVESEPEDWYVDPAVPVKVSFGLDFYDSYLTDYNIHTFSFEPFSFIPLSGVVDIYNNVINLCTVEGENGARQIKLSTRVNMSLPIFDYSHFSGKGSVRFDYSCPIRYLLSPSTGSYPVYFSYFSISCPEFYAFSKEEYDDLVFDQNSQVVFGFPTSFISTCNLEESYVTFSYAPIDDSGLGLYESFTSDFSSFAIESNGTFYIDAGRLIRSSSDDVKFYSITDFVIHFEVADPYRLADNSSSFPNFDFGCQPAFNCSFAYDPRFEDPRFGFPPGVMELQDYTAWITTAVSGFFDIQIFPGFYLSGFLMVVIAFACVIWFLKIFAGG